VKKVPKWRRFIDEYMIDPTNATQAAIRAGFSPKTASEQGSRLLTNVKVLRELEKSLAERAARIGITKDRVATEAAKLAFANMGKFAQWTPGGVQLIPSDQLDEIEKACIQEVCETTNEWGTTVKIKLHDKKGSIELLMRHLGMLNDKLDLTHKGSVRVIHNVPRPGREGGRQEPGQTRETLKKLNIVGDNL